MDEIEMYHRSMNMSSYDNNEYYRNHSKDSSVNNESFVDVTIQQKHSIYTNNGKSLNIDIQINNLCPESYHIDRDVHTQK